MGFLKPEEVLQEDIDEAREARIAARGEEADEAEMLDTMFGTDRMMGVTPEEQPKHLRDKYRKWIEDNPDVKPVQKED